MMASASVEAPLPKEQAFSLFEELETWLRLNPQWHVLTFNGAGPVREGYRFTLEVRYDEGGGEVAYDGIVEEFVEAERIVVRLAGEGPRLVTLDCLESGAGTVLRQEEDGRTDQDVAAAWLRGVAAYLVLRSRKTLRARAWKFWMDRVWLRMSPSGRRIVLLVLIAEGAGFLFFLLFLVVHFALR